MVAAGFGAASRAGEEDRRPGRRAPPAAVERTVAPVSAPGRPAPGWVERPGAGWTEAGVPLRGGGWEGVTVRREAHGKEAPENSGFRWKRALRRGHGFWTPAAERFHFALLRLVASGINSDKL